MFDDNHIRHHVARHRRNADVNITNLMDVMMVLLVVFMVTAPLMTTGISLELPKVGGKDMATEETSINVSVDKNGLYYIGKKELSADKIVAKLNAMQEANKKLSVTISADEKAHYGRVIGLMALLKDAGYEKVGLKTEPKPRSYGKKK